jgi:hypothetical protein
MMPNVNKMLAPGDGLTIRQPTDSSLEKGNIRNPPRFENLGIGGLNSASADGLTHGAYSPKPPGETQRKMPHIKGSKD